MNDSTNYMMGVIFTAAVIAIAAAVSIADLRRKSTNYCCVIASLILSAAVLMMVVCLPATAVQSMWTIFPATAAIIELMLVLTSCILAGIGLVQFKQSQRYRRGRKRAVFTIFGALVFGGFLLYQLQQYQSDSSSYEAGRRIAQPRPPMVAPGPPTVVDAEAVKAKATPTPTSPGAHADAE
jgi:uncharacterized protein YcfJ